MFLSLEKEKRENKIASKHWDNHTMIKHYALFAFCLKVIELMKNDNCSFRIRPGNAKIAKMVQFNEDDSCFFDD